jgi:tRNA threonylcarbamoyladenosine biosynthesis protein TsaB
VIVLAIDASTYAGSVCIVAAGDVVATRTVAMRDSARERLMPAVAESLAEAGVDTRSVDRIVCGAGPGSFTSLRIAASIAKGLATAAGRPLYAVSSLALMVAAIDPPLPTGEYLAVLDALRGESYVATCVVDDLGAVVDVGPLAIVGDPDVVAHAAGRPVVGAKYRSGVTPHARGVTRTHLLLERDGPVDLATWEPDYGRVAEAQRRWEAAHGRGLPRA